MNEEKVKKSLIKPCPFCGTKNVTIFDWDVEYSCGAWGTGVNTVAKAIRCDDCGIHFLARYKRDPETLIYKYDPQKIREELIKKWNTRNGKEWKSKNEPDGCACKDKVLG